MPDWVEVVTALLYLCTAVFVSSIGIPQTFALARCWRCGDGLNRYRLLWVLLMAAICLGTTYRALVWIDLTLFDQGWMGAIDRRWPIELLIALMVMIASGYAAGLYWTTRKELLP